MTEDDTYRMLMRPDFDVVEAHIRAARLLQPPLTPKENVDKDIEVLHRYAWTREDYAVAWRRKYGNF